jgi:hypothetical protein
MQHGLIASLHSTSSINGQHNWQNPAAPAFMHAHHVQEMHLEHGGSFIGSALHRHVHDARHERCARTKLCAVSFGWIVPLLGPGGSLVAGQRQQEEAGADSMPRQLRAFFRVSLLAYGAGAVLAPPSAPGGRGVNGIDTMACW